MCLVAQLYLTLCDPIDCSLPGSSVHGILQARIPEWVGISFSGGSSRSRDWSRFPVSPALAGGFLTPSATEKSIPSPKSKGPREESEWTFYSVSLTSLHQLHTLCPLISFHNSLLFIKPGTKTLTIQPFLQVISLWSLLCHIKLMLNKFVCCSPVNLFLSNFQTQTGTQRGWRKTFSSSTVFILWFLLRLSCAFYIIMSL